MTIQQLKTIAKTFYDEHYHSRDAIHFATTLNITVKSYNSTDKHNRKYYATTKRYDDKIEIWYNNTTREYNFYIMKEIANHILKSYSTEYEEKDIYILAMLFVAPPDDIPFFINSAYDIYRGYKIPEKYASIYWSEVIQKHNKHNNKVIESKILLWLAIILILVLIWYLFVK